MSKIDIKKNNKKRKGGMKQREFRIQDNNLGGCNYAEFS
jgi:hypothetical protein